MIASVYSGRGRTVAVADDVAGEHAVLEGDEDRVLDRVRLREQAEVPEHQDGGQDQGGGIDHVLAGVLRRRTVHRFEDRHLAPDVRARREAETSHEGARQVGQDVAVHVRHHEHVELFRALHELVRAVVHDQMPRLDVGVVGCDLLEHPLQRPLGQLHDVRLRRARDLGAVLAPRVLEGESRDLLASLHRDQLQRLRDARGLHVLDAGVEVLDVLSDHDEIDATAAVGRLHAGELTDRPDVRVGLEQLPERDVRALLAEAHGGLERPFQHHAGTGQGRDRLLRDARGQTLLEHLGSGLGLFPVDRGVGRLDDPPGGFGHFASDAVAGDEGDGDPVCRCGHERLLR